MSQTSSELLIEKIQALAHDLDSIDNQLHVLENEGMNQLQPWGYLALQPRVDRLIQRQHALQDAWDQAMNELACCRSEISPLHRP